MMDPRRIVALPEEELDRIYRTCSPPWRRIWSNAGWQAILSCNEDYEVWSTTRLGRTPEDEREHLPLEDFPHLRLIIQEVLRLKPARRGKPGGGRIFVRDDEFWFSPGKGKERLRVGIVRRVVPVIRA